METKNDWYGETIEGLLYEVPVGVLMDMEEDYLEDIDEDDDLGDEYCEKYDDYECTGYEWTAEDSWDALTDGMYGDMPTDPLEYDAMMDALGF